MVQVQEGEDWKAKARSNFEAFMAKIEKDSQGKNLDEIEKLAGVGGREMTLQFLMIGLMSQPEANPKGEFSCPRCKWKLRIQDKAQERPLNTQFGELKYPRPYGVCDRCGYTGAPLDEALGIPRSGPSIGALHKICHAAVITRSFQGGADVLRVQAGIDFSRKHVRALAEGEGRRLVKEQAEEVKLFEEHKLEVSSQENPELIAVCCDGGRIQTREDFAERKDAGKGHEDQTVPENKEEAGKKKDRWKEDKIGAVYDAIPEPNQNVGRKKYQGAKAQTKTMVATMQPWEYLGWLLRLEAERRGYENAREKIFLADGAPTIRNLKELHFRDARFILDWRHAKGHLKDCAKAAFGEGTEKGIRWHEEHKEMLWEGKRDQIIADIQELSRRLGPPEKGEPETSPRRILWQNASSYFPNNKDAIDYPYFRAQGWPIGSGVAEGAVNQFGIRLKGSRKFWNISDTGAEEMLSLCALHFSEDGRWDQYWRRRAQPQQRE